MRRRLIAGAVVLAACLGVAGWLAFANDPTEPDEWAHRTDAGVAERRAVWGALEALWSNTGGDAARADGALRGKVVSPTGPVADARVVAYRTVANLSEHPSACGGARGHQLLDCDCVTTRLRLQALLADELPHAQAVAETRTAADGTFVLEGLPDEPLSLQLVHPTEGAERVDDVQAGQGPLLVALRPSARYRGAVSSSEGPPLPGARVFALDSENGHWVADTTAEADGRFSLGPLPRGNYWLLAMYRGQLPQLVYVDASEEDVGNLALERPGTLVVRVRRATSPAHGARVALEEEGEHPRHALTDSAGNATFTAIRPGTHRLTAALEVGPSTEVASTTVELASETLSHEATLTLSVGATFAGSVVDEVTGRPLPGVELALLPEVGLLEEATLRSDEAGRFRRDGLPAGTYYLQLRSLGFLLPDGESELDAPVVLTPGQLSRRTLKLREGAVLEGHVVDGAGRPVEGAWVTAHRPGTRARKPLVVVSRGTGLVRELGEQQRSTDATGRFRLIGLVPGPYQLEVSHPQHPAHQLSVSAPASSLRAVLADGLRLSGRVTDERGQPQPGAFIHLFGATSSQPARGTPETSDLAVAATDASLSEGPPVPAERSAEADAEGRFELEGLPPGSYRLLARVATRGVVRSASKRVVLAEPQSFVEVAFDAGRNLSGQVVDRLGRPVAGARLTALSESDEGLCLASSEVGCAELPPARSGPDGTFLLSSLLPGRYEVRAEADGHVEAAVQAEAGDTGLRLVLGRPQRITGRVVDAAGAPVKRFDLDGSPHYSERGEFAVDFEEPVEQLTFSAPGFAPTTVAVRAELDKEQSAGDVRLRPGRRVTLTVLEAATDRPLEGVAASWTRARGNPDDIAFEAEARTDAAGHTVLSDLDAEVLRLELTHPRMKTLVLAVPAGQESVVARMDGGIKLLGTALAADGRPLAGARLALVSKTDERSTFADPEGTFILQGLEPGAYQLEITPLPDASLPTNVHGDNGTIVRTVTIHDAAEQRLAVRLAPGEQLATPPSGG